MDKKQIDNILAVYKSRFIQPLVDSKELSDKLLKGLEEVLSEADSSLQTSTEIASINPFSLKNTGDISFHSTGTIIMYGIGQYYNNGKVNSSQGRMLIYFLLNVEKDIPEEELNKISGDVNFKERIEYLMRQINQSSKYFRIIKSSHNPPTYKLQKVETSDTVLTAE